MHFGQAVLTFKLLKDARCSFWRGLFRFHRLRTPQNKEYKFFELQTNLQPSLPDWRTKIDLKWYYYVISTNDEQFVCCAESSEVKIEKRRKKSVSKPIGRRSVRANKSPRQNCFYTPSRFSKTFGILEAPCQDKRVNSSFLSRLAKCQLLMTRLSSNITF